MLPAMNPRLIVVCLAVGLAGCAASQNSEPTPLLATAGTSPLPAAALPVRAPAVAYVATEIVDTVFTASMLETGRLTPHYIRLAKVATIGFLTHYFGAKLPRRAVAPTKR